jgi:DNA-binding transcriptional ArsR family regulator
MRERFSLFSVRLFGQNWLLAVESADWDPGTPTEYRQYWQQLKQATGENHVALVLPFVSATVRDRMVRLEIPFLIPGTQMFLPESMVLLTETYGNATPPAGKPLSPVAQTLLLFQIQKGGLDKLSAKELSERLGYSRASMSNATSELEQNHLCETFRKGKEQKIAFIGSGKELWKAGLPRLRSPVRKTQFVTWENPPQEAKRAGFSALSMLSLLNEDPVPVYALQEKSIRQGLDQGQFNGCPDRYGADAQLESWSYNPALLSDHHQVDTLSLYLSLRKDPDERVQAALEDMLEAFPWQ